MADPAIETTDFPDGNIILSLETRRFRVNKDLLGSKSGVFSDLFDTAVQADGEASIPIQDDEEAFSIFLHAIYDKDLDSFFPKLSRKTTNLISHVLDLYDKYNVDQTTIRPKLISYIQRDWPETLTEWDANEEEINAKKVELENKLEAEGSYLGEELDNLLPEPATQISFAYNYVTSEKPVQDVPSYLPAAFYHLSRIPLFADPEDPTSSGADYYDYPGLRSANKSLLRQQDFVNLLHGVHELRNDVSKVAFTEFVEEVAKGTEPESETKIMLDWWRKFGLLKLLGPGDAPDYLQRLKEIMKSLEENTSDDPDFVALYQGTSVAFRRRMRAYLNSEREEMWSNLVDKFCLYSFFY